MKRSQRLNFLHSLIIILLIGQYLAPITLAQPADPAAELLASMTVEEKVGQLFVVPFVGDNTGPDSEIATLITEYKIGGVVLQASNSNFRNYEETPRDIAALNNALQAQTLANHSIPLFIAIDHEGDGWPYTRVTGGVTPVPSPMSIGATWNTENAKAVGNIVGRELSAMGVNMLLGPDLDVLNDPRPVGKGDIGIRTFGGDPFWVGAMGKAYIQGVHEGSNDTIITVAKHFPGHGGSDRLPDSEVATVDKSLQELKRIELAPFFAVTQIDPEGPTPTELPSDAGVTDAMMSSHIRYRGLQGDIRQFTAPISFDAQGMTTLLELPEFATWRNNGGLIISDALGVRAVRKHYDPALTSFPHRRIAREAFLAGNDVLILAEFALESIWSLEYENIKDTLEFFRSEYEGDREFAARVDESVMRILRQKLILFPNPSPNALFVDGEVALAVSDQGSEIVNRIAQDSISLLHPTPEEYSQRIGRPPSPEEKILIVSDVRQVRECYLEECEPFEPLGYRAIEQTILEFYGREATRQVQLENIASMNFEELKQVLVGSLAQANQQAEPIPEGENQRSPDEVMALIQEADWIIFATLDLNTDRYPASDALKLFLAQGLNSLEKNLIVFAFNSPYYLDTTEVNKLTAYFGLYSKTQPHLEMAVKALFGETTFPGAAPVTVDGISYDLPSVLAPDPNRAFPIQVDRLGEETQTPPVEVEIRVGPVLDYNGNPVPDNTPVELDIIYPDGQIVAIPPIDTQNGRGETTVVLTNPGLVEIQARSSQAEGRRPQFVEVAAPPATPTETPTVPPSPTATTVPTDTPVPEPTDTVEPTVTPTLEIEPTEEPAPPEQADEVPPPITPHVNSSDFFTALLGVLLTTIIGITVWQQVYRNASQRTRLILITFISGMVGYLLYGVGWLRPDLWLAPDAPIMFQRVTLAVLVIICGLIGNVLERRLLKWG